MQYDSDGGTIYEDSLDCESESDNESIISLFHRKIDVLHIDELLASKSVVLHNGCVVVDFYYLEVRVTVDDELIATLDLNLLCHYECWDDDTPTCTWCGETQESKDSRIFAKFD
ncbi:hypothetical protein TKK_0017115 [Trichogramma kaykai]|uniref:Uncharacterized protein n=1 Tax=Trichogramma kaykai TaxID=54128 RepID=A0ABD2W4J5_9HYME